MPYRLGSCAAVVQCMVVFAACAYGWYYYHNNKGFVAQRRLILQWIEDNNLDQIASKLLNSDLKHINDFTSVPKVRQVLGSKEYDTHKGKLLHAIQYLQEDLIMQYWLNKNGLGDYAVRLKGQGIYKLNDFAKMSDEDCVRIAPKNYKKIKHAVAHLISEFKNGQCEGDNVEGMKKIIWKKIDKKQEPGASCVGAVIFGLLIAVIVTLINTITTGHADIVALSEAPKRLWKLLDRRYQRVTWDWEDGEVVGKTMTFKIEFYDGRVPYPLKEDRLSIVITHISGLYPQTQCSVELTEPHVSTVSFTVRTAGQYKFALKLDNKHITGGPFIKEFSPGPISPSKTHLAVNSATLVCSENQCHTINIEPKDEYGNRTKAITTTDCKNQDFQLTVKEIESDKQIPVSVQYIYNTYTERLCMRVTIPRGGCYKAVVTFKGTKINNGEFNIIVLNEKDSAAVKKNIDKKKYNHYYEARLLTYKTEKYSKAKKVYVYISPKQLTVKEFYLKIIPKRIATFRVCPSTKFHFCGMSNQYDCPMFRIEDGSQVSAELASKDRDIIAATFTNHLLKNVGGSETFKDKQDFFNSEVRQYHSKRPHSKLQFTVHRGNLLENSMKITKGFTTSDWCKNFEVNFAGEEGLDWGGLRREWFELVCANLFDPDKSELFTRFKKDDMQSLVHPNSRRSEFLKPKYYEFAGKMVGKCLYESALGGGYRQSVKAKFSRSFLAQVIGLSINYRYFEQDDRELYTTKIKYMLENDPEDMDIYFVEEEYNSTGQLEREVELISSGAKIKVTNQNKLQYLDALAQYRLANSVKEEVEYFLKGLNDLIPDNLLSIFDENELELLLCGTGNYDIDDFKAYAQICGHGFAFRKVVNWFWAVVASFTQEEMARLLQFTTGSSQLPPEGFAGLLPKFQITQAVTGPGSLPSAHTCFNQLCLPDYDSMDQLHQALTLAITEGNQGFGLI